MKQTTVEWLEKELKAIRLDVDKNVLKFIDKSFEIAKEIEKQQQGYNEEDLECAWNSSDQNMRFQFSSSAYKGITFKQWLEKFKEEKQL